MKRNLCKPNNNDMENHCLIHIVEKLERQLIILEKILMTQEEELAKINAATALLEQLTQQVGKIKSEVLVQSNAIETLKTELANVQISDATVAALDNLSAATSALSDVVASVDAINPDIVA